MLEEVDHSGYDDFLEQNWLFQPLEDTVDIDGDMDTTSFLDFDSHIDALVEDMEYIFYSDEESIDLDSMYDPEEDDIIDSIDLF